jgi:serine/threonine protein kinase
LQDVLRIFEQVVEATCDAHDLGIAHRDIKPNNVCVTSDLQQAFLIDFGICQVVDTQLVLTATDELLGNALFAAPECMPGSGFAPAPHSDVYSLGKLLYWMSSAGQHIHREEISHTVISKIRHPSEIVRYHLSRLLRGTVIADPSRRWNSTDLLKMTAEVMQMIDLLAAQESVGLFTVWDGLGLNDSFYANSHRSVTKHPRGNPPGDHELA